MTEKEDNQLMQGFPVIQSGSIELIIIDKKKYRMQEIDEAYVVTERL
jgi:hypothetical protein